MDTVDTVDPVGTVDQSPAPVGPPVPTQRFALSRARMRGITPVDLVTFLAECPGCGQDAEWTEQREDTRLRVSITCVCTSDSND